jgi:hypothetical protein
MRRECYLCHRDMGHAGDDPPGWPGPGESVTHWLCDECLPLERARWAREEAELDATDPDHDGPGTW